MAIDRPARKTQPAKKVKGPGNGRPAGPLPGDEQTLNEETDRASKGTAVSAAGTPYRGDWLSLATREDVVTILENVPCGVFVVEGPLGKTLYISQGCLDITGYDLIDVPSALVARKILFKDDETRRAQAKLHEAKIRRSGKDPFLSTVICKNGDEKICETRIIGLPDGKLVGVWTDVTRRENAESELRFREKALVKAKKELEARVRERTSELTLLNRELKKSREEMRLLSEHLQRAREEERTRVAREIHDELGQLLTALKMDVAYCEQRIGEGQSIVHDQMRAMEKQIDVGIDTVRRICADLRPHVLERLGLLAGIEWYVRGFEKRTGVRCTVSTCQETSDFDADLSLVLFRVLQEAMTNVARHAYATRVDIELHRKGDRLVLKVRDNGRGISREDIANPGSFGIIGIRERIRFWGGKSTFTGVAGKGTTVIISIPLAQSKDVVARAHPSTRGGKSQEGRRRENDQGLHRGRSRHST